MSLKCGFGTLFEGDPRPRTGRVHPAGEAFAWGCWLRSNSVRSDRRSTMAGRLGIRYPTARLERWMDRRHHHGATRILFIGLRALWSRIFRGVRRRPGTRPKSDPAFQDE
jgi:hypothetical protein